MAIATFPSLSDPPTYFRILADNTTVLSLIEDLSTNCSSLLSTTSPYYSKTSTPYTDTPQPEQIIQYYRASSIALSVDGYNNTATYASDGTPDSPLPGTVDLKLLDCLNQTIGLAAPLIDGASVRWSTPNLGVVGVVWALWWIFGFLWSSFLFSTLASLQLLFYIANYSALSISLWALLMSTNLL